MIEIEPELEFKKRFLKCIKAEKDTILEEGGDCSGFYIRTVKGKAYLFSYIPFFLIKCKDFIDIQEDTDCGCYWAIGYW